MHFRTKTYSVYFILCNIITQCYRSTREIQLDWLPNSNGNKCTSMVWSILVLSHIY